MSDASYNIFNYNYRPAKSIERKLLVELWKDIYGITNSEDCSYIGMGSIFFSDFRLVHKELGLKKMVNIEKEKNDCERFKFNKPYSCIKLKWGTTTEKLPEIDFNEKAIVWLDYDKTLQPYMFEDIDIIFSKMSSGSFYAFTCNPSLTRYHDDKKQAYILEDFKKDFSDYHPYQLNKQRLERKNAPSLILEMINKRIRHVLKDRNATREEEKKLVYLQLLFIKYKDGAEMFTTGGLLLEQKEMQNFKEVYLESLSYTKGEDDEALDLKSPILTRQELSLLNTFLPAEKEDFISEADINFVPEEEKKRYYEVYRYYPTFVEARNY